MSPFFFREDRGDAGFPRVSGDEPTLTAVTASPHAFSPREQG